MTSPGNPVLLFTAILTSYNFLAGGLLTAEILPAKVAGLLILLGNAVGAGLAVWTRGATTPTAAVAARVTRSGLLVAGPAGQAAAGEEVVVARADSGEVVAPPVSEE